MCRGKMTFKNINLGPTSFRKNNKEIYGFDVETCNKNKTFLCATLYSDNPNFTKTFYNKRDCIEYFKLKRFKSSIIATTNLGFDFNALFFNEPEAMEFLPCWRGSHLIFEKSHIGDKKFYLKNEKKTRRTITFLDTLNYASLKVEELGKILNIPKLKTPSFIGERPNNNKEWNELITYNIRDAEISMKFIKFIYGVFHKLGATPQLTIASSAMSLWKNRFLDKTYTRHFINQLMDEFKAYYGGRCEVFKRGEIRNYKYYDYNSLYPSCMIKEYPEPNTLKVKYGSSLEFIESYEGISKVDMECPNMYIPLLPYRTDDKLLFPVGNFSGWYSHLELRKALTLGYIIKKVHTSYYFLKTCFPFRDYVKELYRERKYYQSAGSSVEKIIKLLMNGLYGKFGQKFINRDRWIPMPETIEEFNELIKKYPDVEEINEYLRIKQKFTEPKPFCVPIWALYTTAYARLKLFSLLNKSSPAYCDTDSIITKHSLDTSLRLGDLKLEDRIKYGILIKPKFYGFRNDKGEEKVRIKGLSSDMSIENLRNFSINPTMTFNKFCKFKEGLRRGFIPNEIIDVTKTFSLEDNKRVWPEMFSMENLQDSEALKIGI